MFKSEETIRNVAEIEQQAQNELLQNICDILTAGGYFRARLNIDPFDKVIQLYICPIFIILPYYRY